MSLTHIHTARNEMRRVLLAFLTLLREEFARRLKVQRQEFPNMRLPCETCAFRTSTDDWEGMDQTAINFIAALQECQPFWCHHDMRRDKRGNWIPPRSRVNGKKVADTRRMVPCAAWMVLQSNPPLDIAELVPEPIRKVAVELAIGKR